MDLYGQIELSWRGCEKRERKKK